VTTANGRASVDWTGCRVFVTGATGLVGSWLVRTLLDRGAYVVGLVLDPDPHSELYRSGNVQRVSVVQGALEDFWALERAISLHEVDTVIHLGAQTIVGVAHRFPMTTFESNIRGTYNLLEACRIHRDLVQRVVIASSDKAYGERSDLPYTEDMPLHGRHPYEVSKSCTDLIAQSYHHTYGLPVAIARCGNIYGGGDLNWSRLVPGTIRSLLRGERPIIRSDGTFLRDYIYVEDVIHGFLRLAECMGSDGVRGEGFNFSTESPLSVLDMVDAIRSRMGPDSPEPLIQSHATGEILHQYLSAAKARERLGWEPTFGLDAGLRETVDWYSAYLR
jgi:CDP-glucose 4,6-dehydratase